MIKIKKTKMTIKSIRNLILVIFVFGFGYISSQNLIKYRNLKMQKEEVELLITNEMAYTEEIKNQREYRETDEFTEKVARDKLKLIKPDEIIFKKVK